MAKYRTINRINRTTSKVRYDLESLLSSMIIGNERHTSRSREMVDKHSVVTKRKAGITDMNLKYAELTFESGYVYVDRAKYSPSSFISKIC